MIANSTFLFRTARRGGLLAVCCALTMWAVQPNAVAQASDRVTQLAQSLNKFEDAAQEVREDGFYRLVRLGVNGGAVQSNEIRAALNALFRMVPDRREAITTSLISLLNKENELGRRIRAGEIDGPRGEGSYFGDLLIAVGALHDGRAIDALVENIQTGNIATGAIAELGQEALDRVVHVVEADEDPTRRNGAARTLAQMLGTPSVTLDTPSLGRLKRGLLAASGDRTYGIRLSAVEGLTKLPGADVTATLQKLAERDEYVTTDGRGQSPRYTVREAAKKALQSRPADGSKAGK